MGFLNKFFAPKEVKAALGVLDELNYKYDNEAFRLVKGFVKKVIDSDPNKIVEVINSGSGPREWIYTVIANISGDFLESGKFHLYRGVINPMGPGDGLLQLFDDSLDELVKIGKIKSKEAKLNKNAIRENLKNIG